MKYSKEFIEENEQLKKLDKEALDEQLRNMSTDELLDRMNLSIEQELSEDDLLTPEEIEDNVARIMQLASEDEKPKNIRKFRRTKKSIILAAVIVVIISLAVFATTASNNSFDIKNGVVSFLQDKLSVKVYDDVEDEEYSVTEVEVDLHKNGFDVKIPSFFFEGEWKASKPIYENQQKKQAVNFFLKSDKLSFATTIIKDEKQNLDTFGFSGVENGTTIELNDLSINVYDHGNNRSEIIYNYNGYIYDITSYISYDLMKEVAENFH